MLDDSGYLDHFRGRVLQDALTEATAAYWQRRGDVFDAARPRAGDYPGGATEADLDAARRRCGTAALACRQRAAVTQLYGIDNDLAYEVEAALREVA